VTGTTAHSEVFPPEAPSSAAELTIVLEPFPGTGPLETPSSAGELSIALEPDESSPWLAASAGHPAAADGGFEVPGGVARSRAPNVRGSP
jgi:hypothetical protein